MYKVIIVDDEKQIIDGLCRMIQWRELGFEVAATARNGAEALPLIQSLRPDLVVTDVRMPEMDGLEMLDHARRNAPQDVEFIILSGFSDFKYAQKALQYNVKSYILKPIDEAELYGALVDVKRRLDEKEIRNSLRIRAFINEFVAGAEPESDEEALTGEERYGIRCVAVERHADLLPLAAPAPEQTDLMRHVAERIGPSNMRFVLRHDRNACLIVAGASLLGSFDFDVMRLAACVHEYLRAAKGVPADVLVGRRVPGFRELHESVQSIAACRNTLFYRDAPGIVLYDMIRDEEFRKVYPDDGSAIRIISAFRKNDTEKLSASVEALVEHFKSLRVVPEIALVQMDGVLASLVQILSERQDDLGEVMERYAAYKKVAVRANAHELGRLAQQFCLYCCEYSTARCLCGREDIADKAARYVDEHFAHPIRINEIAERFYVNPAYLGQQFARKKGCSLNHYINRVRIDRAKELLGGTNRKIYEIALDTGFEDPNYFSCKFFEYTGVTPSEYRSHTGKALD